MQTFKYNNQEYLLTEDSSIKCWGLYNVKTREFIASPDQSQELKNIYTMLMSDNADTRAEGQILWEDYMNAEDDKYYICKVGKSGHITLLAELKTKE